MRTPLRRLLLPMAAACAVAGPAAAADQVPGTIGPADCLILNPYPRPNERVAWSGGCRDGYAQGDGVLEWIVDDVVSSRYRGTLVRGRPEGAGEYEYPGTGTRYVGEYRDGRRHGQGRLTLPDGRVVSGSFEQGEPSGEVTITGPGSFRYEGGWRQGRPQGRGRITQTSGATYEGGFERGLYEGQGRLVDPAGNVFEGTFKAGEMHGEGRIRRRDGYEYSGQLRNDRPHGQGSAVYSDGARYEGGFNMGQREGRGTAITAQGGRMGGEWFANLLNGVASEELPGGERRKGTYKAGKLHGQATVVLPDGRTFVGTYENGERHGPGVETTADGRRTEGYWARGVYVGRTAAGEASAMVVRPFIPNTAGCAPTAQDYPLESRRLEEQGAVRIRFAVSAAGSVTGAEVAGSSGFARLDEAALKTLGNCRFTPGRDASGRPTEGTVVIEYVWKLE